MAEVFGCHECLRSARNVFKEETKATTCHHLGLFALQSAQGYCEAGHGLWCPLCLRSWVLRAAPHLPGDASGGQGVRRKEHGEVLLWGRGGDEWLGFRREEEPASWKRLIWLAGFTHCRVSHPTELSLLGGSGGLWAGGFLALSVDFHQMLISSVNMGLTAVMAVVLLLCALFI